MNVLTFTWFAFGEINSKLEQSDRMGSLIDVRQSPENRKFVTLLILTDDEFQGSHRGEDKGEKGSEQRRYTEEIQNFVWCSVGTGRSFLE